MKFIIRILLLLFIVFGLLNFIFKFEVKYVQNSISVLLLLSYFIDYLLNKKNNDKKI